MSDRDEALQDHVAYEPPRVERLLTPAELDQEIVYAGQAASADGQQT
jgi:hypothetical protein